MAIDDVRVKRKLKFIEELRKLEKDYLRYRDPQVMLGLKASTLDSVWNIFSTGVITPDAASFVVGRIYESLAPYRDATYTIKRFEELEAKLADMEREAQEPNAR